MSPIGARVEGHGGQCEVAEMDIDSMNKENDNMMKGPSRKIQRRHSVEFVPEFRTHVFEYESHAEHEAEDVWYQPEEYAEIKARNYYIVRLMRNGSFRDSDEQCGRGLEHKVRDAGLGLQRKKNKANALNAVLYSGKAAGSPEAIAKAYQRVSATAKESAFALACLDAQHALESHDKDRPDLVAADDDETDTDGDTDCSDDAKGTKKKAILHGIFTDISHFHSRRMFRSSSALI